MRGVTPILTDLPPAETLVKSDGSLARPEGSHSNNPYARAAILERRLPQHMAWARQRPDGGRGFGFTGGHVHWNWGHPSFRRPVLNAIAWSAHVNVPQRGVPSRAMTLEQLMANQDFPVSPDFNPDRMRKQLEEWNAAAER